MLKKGGFRFLGLDLLRGIAIIGMVFSATIPFSASWPAWMYHAQVAPPTFQFNPDLPGITWVDLVFPFFLFAMGTAFPFSLRRRLHTTPTVKLSWQILERGIKLIYFAIVLAYMNPGKLQLSPYLNWLSALLIFGCFFLMFLPVKAKGFRGRIPQLIGILFSVGLIWIHSTYTGHVFSKSTSDIIIIVLANMAVFGSFIWMLTNRNVLLRLAILAFFTAIWFTHDIPGSFTANIWNFHPAVAWFYNFSYLKYLYIVLPGSVLGDILYDYQFKKPGKDTENKRGVKSSASVDSRMSVIASISFLLVVSNVLFLYLRETEVNLLVNAVLMVAGSLYMRKQNTAFWQLYKKIFQWGTFLVILGLLWEPYKGGIKKDPSAFSYWFLTAGLSFYFYLFCDTISHYFKNNLIITSLTHCGQNPMIAYSASAFLITPVLGLLYIKPFLNRLASFNAVTGLANAVLLTALVVIITSFATRKGWFWRT